MVIGTYRKSHSSWNSFTTVRAPSPVTTTCRDGKTSQQFQGKVFGYHACGTPELEDSRCQELLYGITNNGGGNNGGSTKPTPGPTYRPTWRPNDRPTNWQWGNTNGFRNGQNKNKKVGATRAQSSDRESGDAVSFVSQ